MLEYKTQNEQQTIQKHITDKTQVSELEMVGWKAITVTSAAYVTTGLYKSEQSNTRI